MKKLTYLALLLSLVLVSCEKTPVASFTVDSSDLKVGQDILFNNTSQNANSFNWDFGDGYVSYDKNPIHYYQLAGEYEVTLTAISKNGEDDNAVIYLTIVEPTLLVVEVLEWTQGYPVGDASVILYPSIADWDNQQNIIIEGFTADDGVVVFANLDPIVHFIDVWEQNHDNYQFRIDGEEWIKTPKIIPNKIFWFVAWVDIVDHGKGERNSDRRMVIKKLERKYIDESKLDLNSTKLDWNELYKRRVIK